jgi:hypothetical protein
MSTPTRIYAIRDTNKALVGLVEAASGPQALHHWARDTYAVEMATVEDGMQAVVNGISVQRAKAKEE